MKNWTIFLLASLICLIGLSVMAPMCGDDDDDDISGIVDDDDDDADDSAAPIISNARFEPDEFTWSEICEDGTAAGYCTSLVFDVCDPGNNLAGGQIFCYQKGTETPASPQPFEWDDLIAYGLVPDDVSDCDNPEKIQVGLYFLRTYFPQIGTYNFAIDMEVTDGSENVSNRLTDISVIIHYEG